MLREADANGDGRISRQEFTELLQSSVVPDSLSLYDDRLGAAVASKGQAADQAAKPQAPKPQAPKPQAPKPQAPKPQGARKRG
jgi:hypothetical protein